VNKKEEVEPEEEMVKDVLQIMNVFVTKMNGRRKYNNKNIKQKLTQKLTKRRSFFYMNYQKLSSFVQLVTTPICHK